MRYPSDEKGLAISPYELGFQIPTDANYQIRGGVEMHHRYHYDCWYKPESDGYGAWRQVFRNMVVNLDPLLTQEHNRGFAGSLHDTYKPPRMPRDAVMIDFVEQELSENGVILLHNTRREQPPKIMPAYQWYAAIKRYKSGTHQR